MPSINSISLTRTLTSLSANSIRILARLRSLVELLPPVVALELVIIRVAVVGVATYASYYLNIKV